MEISEYRERSRSTASGFTPLGQLTKRKSHLLVAPRPRQAQQRIRARGQILCLLGFLLRELLCFFLRTKFVAEALNDVFWEDLFVINHLSEYHMAATVKILVAESP